MRWPRLFYNSSNADAAAADDDDFFPFSFYPFPMLARKGAKECIGIRARTLWWSNMDIHSILALTHARTHTSYRLSTSRILLKYVQFTCSACFFLWSTLFGRFILCLSPSLICTLTMYATRKSRQSRSENETHTDWANETETLYSLCTDSKRQHLLRKSLNFDASECDSIKSIHLCIYYMYIFEVANRRFEEHEG